MFHKKESTQSLKKKEKKRSFGLYTCLTLIYHQLSRSRFWAKLKYNIYMSSYRLSRSYFCFEEPKKEETHYSKSLSNTILPKSPTTSNDVPWDAKSLLHQSCVKNVIHFWKKSTPIQFDHGQGLKSKQFDVFKIFAPGKYPATLQVDFTWTFIIIIYSL